MLKHHRFDMIVHSREFPFRRLTRSDSGPGGAPFSRMMEKGSADGRSPFAGRLTPIYRDSHTNYPPFLARKGG